MVQFRTVASIGCFDEECCRSMTAAPVWESPDLFQEYAVGEIGGGGQPDGDTGFGGSRPSSEARGRE
jgi:hypothetical protein